MKNFHLIAVSCVLFAPSARAQMSAQPTVVEINEPPRRAGTLNVATGIWTRNAPQALGLPQDIVYNNTAFTGHFTTLNLNTELVSYEIIDSARLPSSSGSPGANRDEYWITELEFGYCVGPTHDPNPVNVAINLYESISPCGGPGGATPVGSFLAADLPVGPPGIVPGIPNCWIVQLDLSGGLEVCMKADGDGVFDNDLDLDSFGIGFTFDPGGAGGYLGGDLTLGPMLAGDRDWTSRDPGEIEPASANGSGGGGGTYYGPAEQCLPSGGGRNSSGLDNADSVWVGFDPSSPLTAGCYWFQGYANLMGCNADGSNWFPNPPASLHVALTAAQGSTCFDAAQVGQAFCAPAVANSTGNPCVISGSLTTSGSGVHLEATGGPASNFGFFLMGTSAETNNPLQISDGLLCLGLGPGDSLGRYNYDGTSRNSIGLFDASGILQNLVGTSSVASGFDVPVELPIPGSPTIVAGDTWHFQLWYRDSGSGVGHSNLSNGLAVVF